MYVPIGDTVIWIVFNHAFSTDRRADIISLYRAEYRSVLILYITKIISVANINPNIHYIHFKL